jgi:hypothetical protein
MPVDFQYEFSSNVNSLERMSVYKRDRKSELNSLVSL